MLIPQSPTDYIHNIKFVMYVKVSIWVISLIAIVTFMFRAHVIFIRGMVTYTFQPTF